MNEHKYSLKELEDMLPWERSVYVALLINHIKQETEKLKIQKQNAKHRIK